MARMRALRRETAAIVTLYSSAAGEHSLTFGRVASGLLAPEGNMKRLMIAATLSLLLVSAVSADTIQTPAGRTKSCHVETAAFITAAVDQAPQRCYRPASNAQLDTRFSRETPLSPCALVEFGRWLKVNPHHVIARLSGRLTWPNIDKSEPYNLFVFVRDRRGRESQPLPYVFDDMWRDCNSNL